MDTCASEAPLLKGIIPPKKTLAVTSLSNLSLDFPVGVVRAYHAV
jgi:hypothetical protein